MTEKKYLVRFKSGEEQPVHAENVVEDEEGLVFLDSNGELAALFDITMVEKWHEL